jgi:hypothetical protein
MDANMFQGITPGDILLVAGVCLAAALVGAVVLLILAARQVSEIDIPPEADFFETLQHIPITLPLALDLLDLVFDIFSAPISWIILELLGLQALQLVTVFEGIVPGTQLLPTMTFAWLLARLMKGRSGRSELRTALGDYQQAERQARLDQIQNRSASIADSYRGRALPLPSATDVVEGEYHDEIEEEEFEDDFEDIPPYLIDDEEF